MELIKNEKPLEILQSHIGQWAAVWNAGNIYLEGPTIELVKNALTCQYFRLEDNKKRFTG